MDGISEHLLIFLGEHSAPAHKQYMQKKTQYKTIEEYINTFPQHIQVILAKIRQTIQKAAPDAVETINYGIPAFDVNGKHLVYFAGWKQHISLYPVPEGTEAFQQKIAPYKKSRGTIQFPLDKPIPLDIVEEIVRYHIKNLKKTA